MQREAWYTFPILNIRGDKHMIVTLRGVTPQFHESVFVAETAAVIGRTKIGAGSSVWYGAVIRGDSGEIVVGENTSVQDNVTLHCDANAMYIGNNITIGHNAVVHCHKVGDDTLIGMGAVLLSGAEVGSNCIIAAGAVVREGDRIPDNSLAVGIPARVVKTLAPGAVAAMQMHTHYVELAQEYKNT